MVEDRSCTKKAKYTYKKWQVDLSRKKYRFIVCPIAMLGFFAHKLKSLPRKNRLTVYVGAFIFSEKEEGSILEITCKKVPLFFGQQLHLHKWAWQETEIGDFHNVQKL